MMRLTVVMNGPDARKVDSTLSLSLSLSKELYHVDETRIHRNALWL